MPVAHTKESDLFLINFKAEVREHGAEDIIGMYRGWKTS
jgi:hypothetical protein